MSKLLAAVRSGNARGYEQLMRRYNRRLFRIARGILGDDAEAEDVVQETYMRVFTGIDAFRGPGGFGSWLCRIASHDAIDRARRSGRLQVTDEPASELAEASVDTSVPNPQEFASRRELARFLESAVDRLPDEFRAVFMLRAVEQLTVAETADCLDLNPQTVKTRYHRARRLLKAGIRAALTDTLDELYPFAGARCDRIVASVFKRLPKPH